ncbi:uncharacterized protein EDB93DRAFT_906791 [Suillus bovinus]|uniref:uncharacterized protein n=1 Tax=Suillus bovinus TaxID=48563 RepID=UPI001B87999E|nr:uncharacterized protein EDB93DRAFT_906791 [Suillus bovinus]KAG2132451.1 hypothetical protein EDB93DRAFT_906791 [Suillus bovinus]
MNPFKRMLSKSDDDKTASLKHSKSMPYLLSLEGRTPEHRVNPKPVYRGKTPLKKSDIVYVEQAPGILEIYHGKLSQHTYYHGPTRADFDTRTDLLAKFPHSSEPTEGFPRSGFRTISLNSQTIGPQVPFRNSSTSGQQVYPSILHTTQRPKATVDQASAGVLQIPDDNTRNGRLVERIRANSSTGCSYTPAPTTYSPHPFISRSAHSSRVNIPHVPSHVTIPITAAPDHDHSSKPHGDYRKFLKEQDPNVICRMINQYPIAPLCTERTPEHLRPIRFDMVDQCYVKAFRENIEMAVAQGRPLDVRAGGPYRRIVV